MQLISIGQFHKVIEKYLYSVSAIYWIYRYFGDNHYQCDCLSDVEVGTADSGMDVI